MPASELKSSLKKYFGFEEFRNPQGEIISSILSGRDTLAIMPTGGGKSLCYQLPALMCEGVTLVVSPLIALMKDQVDSLRACEIPAAMINSSQSWTEQREVLDRLKSGALKLAYIAPERFRAASFVSALRDVKISLFAVDEAHCISQWGHDFRPDYMRLGESLRALGSPVCAAFTATATPDVKNDIVVQLGMRNPSIFVSGFARPNLSLNIRQVRSKLEKETRIRSIVEKYATGIIYCATRKSVESLSQSLWKDGIRHVVYHGGMTPQERETAQEAFVGGRENIAVATNAFGMGIDRADIRFVCHYELTGSVEAFYQEAGRAGRDGKSAYCEMLLMYSDRRVQEFFIDGANPDAQTIRSVYRVIRENSDNSYECFMGVENIADEVAMIKRFESKSSGRGFPRKAGSGGVNSMAVSSAISILRRLGFIDRFDSPSNGRVRGTRLLRPDSDENEIIFPDNMLEVKRQRDESKLRDFISFAYSPKCRQQWILDYFGEKTSTACGICDNCRTGDATESNVLSEKLSPEEMTIVKKALSGVVRLSRRVGQRKWSPRFGRDRVLKSLCGSSDAKILDFGLDKISTHGILKEYGKKYVASLLDSMADAGLVSVVYEGDYPLFGITDAGVEILFNAEASLSMSFPKSSSSKKSSERVSLNPKEEKHTTVKVSQSPKTKDDLNDSDRKLYDVMAKERMKLCIVRKIKPFQIFNNATLLEFAVLRPRSAEEAAEIKGVGEAKLRSYVPVFIKIIENFSNSEI